MTGKWHLTKYTDNKTNDTEMISKDNWPLQRGFDRFFDTIAGAGSYFNPISLVEGNELFIRMSENFYYTDAITN